VIAVLQGANNIKTIKHNYNWLLLYRSNSVIFCIKWNKS